MNPEDNFRNLIRSRLRGSFDTEASKQGLKMVDEVDDPGQAPQQGAGVDQAATEKTVKGLLLSLGNVIKTNNKLGSGVSVGLKDSDIKKMATDVASAVVKGDVNSFKKGISNGADAINKQILDFAKKQQTPQAGADNKQDGQNNQNNQNNQEGQPGAGPAQPLNAAETPGHDIYSLGEPHPVTHDLPADYQSPMREVENPISVSAMQGILKFATPTQVGDAVKSMNSDQFAKFASGLKKDALDVLSEIVNNQGGGKAPDATQSGKPANAQKGHGGGDNNAEGNVKLGDL